MQIETPPNANQNIIKCKSRHQKMQIKTAQNANHEPQNANRNTTKCKSKYYKMQIKTPQHGNGDIINCACKHHKMEL
jgi:hypothetical protein